MTDKLLSKKTLVYFVLLIAYFLFHEYIIYLYDNRIVESILSKIKGNGLTYFSIALLSIITTFATLVWIQEGKRIKDEIVVLSIVILLTYCYYRFGTTKYVYTSFNKASAVIYADYIILFLGSILLLKLVELINLNQDSEYASSPFLIDKPIGDSNADKFGRKIFAKKIAEKIQSKLTLENAGALAIGINGAWGSGKTSFANMIKSSIDPANRIQIDFNPWRSSSSEKIIEDFFELLIAEIKPHDPNLSNTITDYAKTLTKIDENILTKSSEAISSLLFEDENKNVIYASINTSIEKIKKQIIIYIDDLDRLDKKEVIEVLRLIRNTANFNNVVYVVSYDKGYVQTAVTEFNEYNSRSFLEKIFQFEFTLPMYEHGVLRTEIKLLLKAGLGTSFHKEIDRVVDSSEYYGINFTNEIIKTYRDVIRFVNSLLFEIEIIKEEVYFYDFYLIQLLKQEHPKVYETIADNSSLIFTKDPENGLYRLKTKEEAWDSDDLLSFSRAFKSHSNSQPQNKEKDISSLEHFLLENSELFGINDYDKNLILYIINTLLKLKETKSIEDDASLYKSFAYPENFHKYFALRLYEGDISSKEFEDYRRMDFEDYKNIIFKWINEGKYSALIDRLDKVQDFANKIEFENHIKILFELGRYEIKHNNPYWFDYGKIVRSLRYPIRYYPRIPKLYIYDSEEDYKNFYLDLLNSAPKPPLFESHVNARLIVSGLEFIISTDDLSNTNLEIFEEYCSQINSITSEFWQFYRNCKIKSNDSEGGINPIANELAKQNFKTKIYECDLGRFIKQNSPGSLYYYLDREQWSLAFDTLEEFEEWFNTIENINRDSDCFKEFLKFFNTTKDKAFKSIVFDFAFLQPIRYE